MMTFDSHSKADLLADYRDLLRIAKERPAGILTQPESSKLINFLEGCIAEIEAEAANDDESRKLTG